jgi:hypothetical protein
MNAQKITKRQYEAQTARMQALRQQLCDQRDQAIRALEDLPALDSFAYGEMLNHLHDAISEIENVIASVEEEWSTRKWTRSDWASYELVARNID